MPIKAENMALYPGGSIKSPEWLAIRAFIRARAGDCCEGCGVGNGLLGVRLPDGAFMELKRIGGTLSPAQKLFQARCIAIGVTYVVVADIDTALAILEGWRIILPEAEF